MSNSTNPKAFYLKQFSMYHHRSTMKIGTDAMILSAWVDLNNVNFILDVGTGSGIIALMMAARSSAAIDAIEIDEPSAIEARENFNNSPFNNRLHIYQNDFKIFAEESTKRYDLIISNPPFFINDMKPENSKRKQARHTDSLTFSELSFFTKKLLDKNGRFCLVLPYSESKIFVAEASKNGLYLNKKQLIFPKPCKEPNRVNLELSLTETKAVMEEKFIIRDEQGLFTQQYVNLLGEYYTSIKS
jgi:tRNA1Val (adenine37-N6)-methyltransferase